MDSVKQQLLSGFSFLESEWGLNSPVVEEIRTELAITYSGRPIGVSVQITFAQFFVYVTLFKSEHGEIPRDLTVPEEARRVIHLTQALTKLGVLSSPRIDELVTLAGNSKNCPRFIAIYRELLQRNWNTILERQGELFP